MSNQSTQPLEYIPSVPTDALRWALAIAGATLLDRARSSGDETDQRHGRALLHAAEHITDWSHVKAVPRLMITTACEKKLTPNSAMAESPTPNMNIETRSITDHRVNGLNEYVNIIVLDGPGPGGASHHYRVEPITHDHPQGAINPFDVVFQKGPVNEVGVNGCSIEALLAICIDRLRGFQSGSFACRDNAIALTHIEDAVLRLHKRTRERIDRGVEGTTAK